MNKFCTLVWKKLLLTRRNWGSTACEFLFPVVVVGILWFILTIIGDEDKVKSDDETVKNVSTMGSTCGRTGKILFSYNMTQRPNPDDEQKLKQIMKKLQGVEFVNVKKIDKMLSKVKRMSDGSVTYMAAVTITKIGHSLKELEYTLSVPVHTSTTMGEIWLQDNPYIFTKSLFEQKGQQSPYPDYISNCALDLQRRMDSLVLEINGVNTTSNTTFIYKKLENAYFLSSGLTGIVMAGLIVMVMPLVFNSVRDIVDEKESDMKGFLAVYGVSSPSFYLSHIVITFIKAIIVTSMGAPLIHKLSGTTDVIPWIFLSTGLYATNIACLSMMLSTLLKKTSLSSGFSQNIWSISVGIVMFTREISDRRWKIALSFNINNAYIYSLMDLTSMAARKRPLNAIFEDSNIVFTTGHAYLIMIANSFILIMLSVAFELFSNKLEWTNIRALFGKGSSAYTTPKATAKWQGESCHEIDPSLSDKDPNINIEAMHKVFPNGERAVNGLNLQAYSGQITVLLGHNGAGKSTIFNILCKIMEPTSGKVEIEGDQFGLCRQTNSLFEPLTVKEHLLFFHRLKGSKETFEKKSKELMKALSLDDKMDVKAADLSGGQKRKLCVAIALIGRSQVVLLDEPTAGMDPGARKDVERLLEKVKKDRTILLTTHHMDEAEALGDRIIIIAQGKAAASGTTDFLKKRFGTGYFLTIVLLPTCIDMAGSRREIKKVAESIIPGSTLSPLHGKQFDVVLPSEKQDQFGDLFAKLEEEKENMQIDSFGLSLNSLEQVFLTVGELNETNNAKRLDKKAFKALFPPNEEEPLYHGCALFLIHVLALHYKRGLVLLRNGMHLFEYILLPVIITIIVCCLPSTMNEDVFEQDMSVRNLGSIKTFSSTENSSFEDNLSTFLRKSENVEHSVYNGNLEEYMNHLPHGFPPAGFGFSQKKKGQAITFLYKGNLVHALPMMQNVYSNMIGASKGVSFKTTMRVVRVEDIEQQAMETMMKPGRKAFASIFAITSLSLLLSGMIFTVVHERITKFRHQQLLTPLSAFTYWTQQWLFDTYIYAAITLAMIMAWHFAGIYGDNLNYFFAVIWLLHLGVLPFFYFIAPMFKTANTASSTILAIFSLSETICIGLVIAQLFLLPPILKEKMKNPEAPDHITPALYWTKIAAMIVLPMVAVAEASGLLMHELVTSMPVILSGYIKFGSKFESLESNDAKIDFMTFETEYGIKAHCVCLIIFAVVFFALFICSFEICLRKCFYQHFSGCCAKNKSNAAYGDDSIDPDVVKEERDVFANGEDLVVNVNSLDKSYGGYKAVKCVTFGVRAQECFGLLGQNGAGKTSIFDIIAGLQFENDGYVEINGTKSDVAKLGYCPQFDALPPEMTGRETLVFICMLHGYRDSDEKANQMLEIVGLEMHGDKRFSNYSGGQRRKLSVAVAILSQSQVMVLDEPTAGIDPKARRDIWTLLSMTRERRDCAIVLSSHSMEECEALCSKIGILKEGKLIAIGSSQHLKSKYSNSYTATVVLKTASQRPIVESAMMSNFPALKKKTNEFKGTVNLKWTIPRKPADKWSELWNRLQKIAKDCDVKDYCLIQSSLEDTFIKLTGADVEEDSDSAKNN